MKTDLNLNIIYQHYIPDTDIIHFESTLKETIVFNKIEIERKELQARASFYGPQESDIILIFVGGGSFILDAMLSGVIGNSAYGILKAGIVHLWSKIQRLDIKKVTSQTIEDKVKRIDVSIRDAERSVEITIEGKLSEESSEQIIDRLFESLKAPAIREHFQNPELIEPGAEKPRIRIRLNPESNKYEPVNFEDYKRQMEEYMKKAEEELEN